MQPAAWEFWIDVGGTFTDCFARRPDGTLLRHKLLSSGVTKGAAAADSTRSQIVDPLRAGDVPGFWQGYTLRLLGSAGQVVAESVVSESAIVDGTQRAGVLRLGKPLAIEVQPGQA